MYVGVPTQSQSLPSAARGQAAADPAQHANSTASADAPVPKRRPQLMRSLLLPLRAAKHVAGKLSISFVRRRRPTAGVRGNAGAARDDGGGAPAAGVGGDEIAGASPAADA